MNEKQFSHIILMKAGPYCGYSLDEIIKIKQGEQNKVGKYFWGYGGVFCRPNVVHDLVKHANGKKVYVLFVETKSNFIPSTFDRFEEFSTDGKEWENLPKEVLLVGNKSRSHFAITAKKLEKVEFDLDISKYCTIKGLLSSERQSFDKYFKYRVDKACGVYMPNETIESKIVNIKYISELVEPYSVMVR